MSWNITYHDQRPAEPKIGDMWPIGGSTSHIEQQKGFCSEYYRLHWATKRPPLMVALPHKWPDGQVGYTLFMIDSPASDDPTKKGWSVQHGELRHGQQPDITLSPSINIVGHYHGWIRNGVITDDCEGRTF